MGAETVSIPAWTRRTFMNGTNRTADVPVLVSLVRLHDRRSDSDRFVCDGADWNLMLEVAVSFGWKQRGTTYLPQHFSSTNAAASSRMTRHDYRPGDAGDPKYVDNIDAIAWAAALSTGCRSPYLPGMLAAVQASDFSGTRQHDPAFDAIMKNFTQYAFGGGFAFSRTEQR